MKSLHFYPKTCLKIIEKILGVRPIGWINTLYPLSSFDVTNHQEDPAAGLTPSADT